MGEHEVDPEVRTFLAGRHMATLGTTDPDGAVHLTAVWYAHDGEAVWVITNSRTRKARNAARTGTASIMVDSHERGPLKGAMVSCAAEVITGEVARHWNRVILERYVGPEGLEDPRVGGLMSVHDDCVIRLVPRARWAWWNLERAFGGVLETPGYLLPLSGS